jgi:hypothetical protein
MLENKVANILSLRGLFDTPEDLLFEIGLSGRRVYKNSPKVCKHCFGQKFDEVELLAISEKPMLWECSDCGDLYLRYKLSYITEQFSKAAGLWTSELDWEVPPRSNFN